MNLFKYLLSILLILNVAFLQSQTTITVGAIAPAIYCQGASVNIPYAITGSFFIGNEFKAQLSDSSGSFSTPSQIGTQTGISSDTIHGTIPTGAMQGNGYKIRIISTSPQDTSDNAVTITINSVPANAGAINGISPVCQGRSGVIYSVGAIANSTSYIWNYTGSGATLSNAGAAVIIDFSATATSGILSVKGHNDCGDGGISTFSINVNPLPAGAGTITGITTVCQGRNNVTYTVPTINNATSTIWTLPFGVSGTSTTNSITVSFGTSAVSGNITVRGHNTCGNGDSSALAITVNPLPDPSINLATPSDFEYLPPATFRICDNLNSYYLTLINTSSTQSVNDHYQIDWGDSSALYECGSTFNPPPHLYDVGRYTLVLTVTNSYGCLASRSYTVFIGTNPSAISITTPPGQSTIGGCVPRTYTFNITYGNDSPGTEYIIAVNDGSDTVKYVRQESVLPPETFVHTFNRASCGIRTPNGIENAFFVRITATNSCETTANIFEPVKINSAPKADFSISPESPVCKDNMITFTNTSAGACYYSLNDITAKSSWEITPSTGWNSISNFGTPPVLNGNSSIYVTFTTPGIYAIKLYSGNNANPANLCTDDTIKTICVSPRAAPSFSLNKTTFCQPDTVKITNATDTLLFCNKPVTYTWNTSCTNNGCAATGCSGMIYTNGTTAGSRNPSIKFTQPGIYSLSLTADNGCGPVTSGIQTITVKDKPTVTFTVPGSVCANDSICPSGVTVTNCYGTSLLTYSWTSSSGTFTDSASQTPGCVDALITGNQTITLSASNECGSTPFSRSVQVKPLPAVISSSTLTICSGISLNYAIFSTVGGSTYRWGRAEVSGISNPAVSNQSANPVTETLINITSNPVDVIYLIIPSANGCRGNTFTYTVTVNPKPAITAMTSTVCSGIGFSLTPVNIANGIVPSGTTYSWAAPAVTGGLTGGAAANGASAISGTLSNPTYAVQTAIYTVTPISGGCRGATFTITVTVKPKPAITAMASTVCTDVGFTVVPVNTTNGIVPAGTTYSWAIPTVTGGISGGAADSAEASIIGTLTNLTNTSQTAAYTATPLSGSCQGQPFTVTVTVNPKPAVTAMDTTVCGGFGFAAAPVNNSDGIVPAGTTYSWAVPTVSGGLNGGSAGSGAASISGVLTNIINTAETAIYSITPTSGSCTGLPFMIIVTVNPKPFISPQAASICSGAAFMISPVNNPPTAIIPMGTTYTWRAPVSAPAGAVTGGSAQLTGQPSIIQTLNNATVNPATATYTVTPTSGSCPGTSFSIIVAVYPDPVITAQPSGDTLCAGGLLPVALSISYRGGTGTPAYQWYYNTNNSNSGGSSVSGATNQSYTPPAFNTAGTFYYYATISVSGSGCDTVTSNVAAIIVVDDPIVSSPPGSQTLCQNASPANLTITASGGVGTFAYQWYSNTVNNNTSGILINGATSRTYTPLTSSLGTAFYYCVITQTGGPGCSVTCSTSEVITLPGPVFSTQPASSTVCVNGVPSLLSVSYTNGTGSPSYQWYSNLLNNNYSGALISGATNTTYSPPASTAGTAYYYCVIALSSGGCASITSNTATVTVNPDLIISSHPSGDTLCIGGTLPVALNISYTGGTGTPSYQWYSNTINSNTGGSSVSGATNQSYTPSAFNTTGTFYYYVVISLSGSGCDAMTSNVAAIEVVNDPVVSSPLVSQTLCQNAAPANLTILATGGVGTFAYQWYSNAVNNNTSGTLISGATNTTYIPHTTTPGTVYYYCAVTQIGGPGCAVTSSTSEVITIQVPVFTSQPVSSTVCVGGIPALLSVSYTNGTGTPSYQWYYNTVNNTVSGTLINGTTSAAYIPPALTAGTTYYYCIITFSSGGCANITSNTATITVNPGPIITVQPMEDTVCIGGMLPIALNAGYTGGTGVPSYQWYSNTTNSNTGGFLISGATNQSYTPPVFNTSGLYYYYAIISLSGSGCDPVTSNVAIVTVIADPAVLPLLATQTLCQYVTPGNLTVSATGGIGVFSYKWYSNTVNNNTTGTLISGETNSTYTPPTTNLGTAYYYCVITQTGGRGCGVSTSVAEVITNHVPAFTTQPDSGTVCLGGVPAVLYVAYTNGAGSPSYQWYINTLNNNTSGTLINGATNSTYNPASSAAGTNFYYCVITFSSGVCANLTSNTAKVTVNPDPVITVQTNEDTLCEGGFLQTGINASYTGGIGAPAYQWYINTTNSITGGIPVSGATNQSYIPPIFTTAGKYYYYAVVSLSGNGCDTATSNIATIVIVADPAITVPLLPQSLCQNASPDNLSILATGGVGTFTYQWFSSIYNNYSMGTLISGATGSTYSPPTTTVDTNYFYCVITQVGGSGCAVTSSTAEIIISSAPTFSTQPVSSTLCMGGTPDLLTVAYINGTGMPSYQWYSNTINNNTSGTLVSGATSTTYDPPSSAAGTTYYYCIISFSSGGCASITSNTALVDVKSDPQIISQPTISQNLCVGGNLSSALTVNYSGGTGIPVFQWYSNATNSNSGGTIINGANSPVYSPPTFNTSGNYYFYATLTLSGTGCDSSTSNTASVNVFADPVITTQPLDTQSLCQNAVPVNLSIIVSGGTGAFSYQWYSNLTNSNSGGNIIPGATGTSYTPPTTTAGAMYYYCVVNQTGQGCLVISATAKIIINIAPSVITQPIPSTVCVGGTPHLLTVAYNNGTGMPFYQWYSNTINNNTSGTLVSGATSATYDPPSSAAGTNYYYCVISFSSGGCASITSNTALIDVKADPQIGSQPTISQNLCVGGNLSSALTVNYTGGTGIPVYQWYSNTTNSNSGGALISGANSSAYTPPTFNTSGNYYYYATLTLSGTGCDSATSNTATVNVFADPVITTQPLDSQSLCQNAVPVNLSVAVSGGTGAFSYQWYSNLTNSNSGGIIIPGATGTSYTPPSAITGAMYYYCVVNQTGPGCLVISATAEVIINLAPSVITQPIPSTVCVGGTPHLLTVAYTNGTGTPSYQWYSNTINNNTTGILVSGATNTTYDPPSSAAGTDYYYCVISFSSGGCASITSNTASVDVKADPAISSQPTISQNLCVGGNLSSALTVNYTGGTGIPVYQWYSNTTNSNSGGTLISGANMSAYTPSTFNISGNYYYYATLTLSGTGCDSATSNTAAVNVFADPVISTQSLSDTICNGENHTLTVTLMGGTGTFNYQWQSSSVGCGSGMVNIAGATNAAYTTTALSVTTYYQCIISQTGNGCNTLTSSCDTILVLPKPIAQMGMDIDNGCSPKTIEFTNMLSTGMPDSFIWDFGDGSPQRLSNYTDTLHHTFYTGPNISLYIIRLIAINDCGIDTLTDTVRIHPNLVHAFIEIDTSAGCTPFRVLFRNHSTPRGLSYYNWDFGDGNHSSSANDTVYHTYNSAGNYTIILYATDSCGYDSDTINITVWRTPDIDFTSNCSSCCYYDTVSYTAISTANISDYYWDFGDNDTSGFTNPQHLFDTSGVYNTKLTVTTYPHHCPNSITKQIIIKFTPEINVSPFPFSENCTPFTVSFENHTPGDPSGSNNYYRWNFDDGNTSALPTPPPHTFYNFLCGRDTAYRVRLIAENNGCYDTSFTQIIVHPSPVSNINTPDSTFCTFQSPASVQFFDGSPLYSCDYNLSTEWLLNNLHYSYYNNPVIYLNTAGVYNIELITVNSYGCSDTMHKSYIVYSNPFDSLYIDPKIGCEPLWVYFSVSSTNNIYNWNFGDGTSGTSYQTQHLYTDSGSFPVWLTVMGIGGCIDSISYSYIIVHPKPHADFSYSINNIPIYDGMVYFINLSSSVPAYEWDFGDGTGFDTTFCDVSHHYYYNGSFRTALIASNIWGCADTAYKPIIIDDLKGLFIPNAFAPSDLNDGVNVFKPVGVGLKEYSIQIFDAWGNEIWSSNAINEEGKPEEAWDGKSKNGTPLPQDIYVWKAYAVFKDGSAWQGMDYGDGKLIRCGTIKLVK